MFTEIGRSLCVAYVFFLFFDFSTPETTWTPVGQERECQVSWSTDRQFGP